MQLEAITTSSEAPLVSYQPLSLLKEHLLVFTAQSGTAKRPAGKIRFLQLHLHIFQLPGVGFINCQASICPIWSSSSIFDILSSLILSISLTFSQVSCGSNLFPHFYFLPYSLLTPVMFLFLPLTLTLLYHNTPRGPEVFITICSKTTHLPLYPSCLLFSNT